jgi:PAS domain-containing protein
MTGPRLKQKAEPGLHALEACGAGFWEFDLLNGSAWFSDWFHQRLGWAAEDNHSTLRRLEPAVDPAAWRALMAALRDHLERGLALDLELEVILPTSAHERWRIRGSAVRNHAGRPLSIAGSMHDVSQQLRPAEQLSLERLRGAFESLPVAAALLDGHAAPLESNRLWQSLPETTVQQAIARLKVANSQTAIEFWLDQGEGFEAGARRLRVRAVAYQHEGVRHLAVTVEDRRSD